MALFTFNQWTILPNANKAALTKHFPSMDAVFQLKGHIISASDQSEIFAQTIGNTTYYIKRYFASKGFTSWLGFSRFRTERKNQLWFNQLNLPSARVVAHGETSFFFKTKKGVLILEGIDNAIDLAEIARQQPEKFNLSIWRNQLISQLGDILHVLHAHRFCHNDLHWRNILIQENETTQQPQAYLIDCPFGRKLCWPFLNYKKLKDLANIDKLAPKYLSRTQRLRFFYAYRKITKLQVEDKIMIRNILQHKANRIKRKAKENKGKNKK